MVSRTFGIQLPTMLHYALELAVVVDGRKMRPLQLKWTWRGGVEDG